MFDEQCANIIVLGHTGAGKSSFINYLINQDLMKTGNGKPVTQNFDSYLENKTFGIPIRIYDSKGYEVGDYKNIADDTIKFINDKCSNDDVYQWIHTVFYCINSKRARVDDSEIALIKRIQTETMRTPHIVLTNCDGSSQDEAMKKYVEKTVGNGVQVYCVNSVTEKTRRGVNEQFGKTTIINGIFDILWFDMLRVMAKSIASDFTQNFEECMEEFKELLEVHTSPDVYEEEVFKSECMRLIQKSTRNMKKYNEALGIIAMEKMQLYADFLNTYGKTNIYIDKNAVKEVVNRAMQALEKGIESIPYVKDSDCNVFSEFYPGMQVSLPMLIWGYMDYIFKLNKNKWYNRMREGVISSISIEFPTEKIIEKRLLYNMADDEIKAKILMQEKIEKEFSSDRKNASGTKENEDFPEDIIKKYGNRVEATTVVKNRYYLFIDPRPASIFVQTAAKFYSKIQLRVDGRTVDAKSILMLLGISGSLKRGRTFNIIAEGSDAVEAVDALLELVASRFGEE